MAAQITTLKVRWSEADPAGIVFYSRFLEWFDVATAALFEGLGLPWPELFSAHGVVGVPIVEVGVTFRAPVRFGEPVTIRSTVAWVRARTFRLEHEVSVLETVRAQGFEIRAWTAAETPGGRLRAAPLPEAVARRLQGG